MHSLKHLFSALYGRGNDIQIALIVDATSPRNQSIECPKVPEINELNILRGISIAGMKLPYKRWIM
jgi:hypothetical protein